MTMSPLRHSIKRFSYFIPLRISKLTSYPLAGHISSFTAQCHKPTISLLSNFPFSRKHYLSSLAASDTPIPDTLSSSYLSVRILCRKHLVDEFSEALLCFGGSSTSVDEQDSDEVCITTIYPESHDVNVSISQAAKSIGLNGVPKFEIEVGEPCDWVTKTQETFHPLQIIDDVWIVPEWRTSPDVHATNIILNPGLAFGTGEHPTTKLCLLLLHKLIKGGETFLDYGTGSGVLAIAALKFGAGQSVGIDVDPVAITSARQNATLNKIGPEKMQLFLVPNETNALLEHAIASNSVKGRSSQRIDVMSETEKFDIVIANILLNPLLELADQIVSYARPGAVLGLSGILSEQLPRIMDRYSEFLEDMSVTTINDWACVTGVKRSKFTAGR